MEGDVLKGSFVRKDNNKTLTTVRNIMGDELVQVRIYDLHLSTGFTTITATETVAAPALTLELHSKVSVKRNVFL